VAYSEVLSSEANQATNSLKEWEWVSLIQLIANPEKYDGHMVLIEGYVNLEFEGNAVYLSKEDWKHRITKNALWIDIDNKNKDYQKFNGRYCLIVGTFESKNKGHMNSFNGEIRDIVRFEIQK